MTLQTQQPTPEHSPAVLTDEQRRRVADALENAQSENTRRNYAGQYRKFRAWCEREEQSALPASARSRGCLCRGATAGVTETLRGLSRQVGVSQKQARPLDADALAAIRATAVTPRTTRGGSLEMEDTALIRGQLDIALASVLSDAGLRISEAAALRWRDVLDAENGAGLVYIERSKTDQTGEGSYVVITPDTLTALKRLRQDSDVVDNDEPVFVLSMSQICRLRRCSGLFNIH